MFEDDSIINICSGDKEDASDDTNGSISSGSDWGTPKDLDDPIYDLEKGYLVPTKCDKLGVGKYVEFKFETWKRRQGSLYAFFFGGGERG